MDRKGIRILSAEPAKAIRAKPRMNAMAQYMLSLAAVIACYSAYVQFAVPLIEGPPNQIVQRAAAPLNRISPREEKNYFAHLLPEDAWELTDCKTLLIDAGTILFKELEQNKDGSLSVVPFTLITGLKTESELALTGEKPGTPMVLRCVSGANLKFNRRIQEVLSGKAKLESARLTGVVNIYRPPSAIDKDDALNVLTSNIQIDKRRVFTLDQVEFWFGQNHGLGRNMIIDLEHDTQSSSIVDFANVKGIRRLELAFLDSLRIVPPAKKDQTLVADPKSNSDKQSLFSNNKSPIEVACQGPFVFDFLNRSATFKKKVVAKQVDAFQDQINCEVLTLTFANDKKSKRKSAATANLPVGTKDPASSHFGDLRLSRLVAEGVPAVIISRSQSARVSGGVLSYDVENDEVIGESNSAADQQVAIVTPEYQLVTQRLNYVIPKDGSLGNVNAAGPGRLLRVKTDTQDEFFTTWQTSLTTRDVLDQPGLQRVVVDGQAVVQMGGATRIDADRLDVWVWQIPSITTDANGDKKRSWAYLPARLETVGDVRIVSPKLDGQAKHLTVAWTDSKDHVLRARSENQPESLQQKSTAATNQRPNGQGAGQGNQARPTTALQSSQPVASAQKPITRKLRFGGETVDIRLVGTGEQMQILDLTVLGDVTIVDQPIGRAAQSEGAQTPLTIKGHRLQLTPQKQPNSYRTMVTGKAGEMATVIAQDFILKGQSINLDQAANKVWVEGQGEMHLEVSPQPSPANPIAMVGFGQPQEGFVESKTESEDLDVSWEGGMIFDGSKIYFERRVVLSAERPAKDGKRSSIQSLSAGLSVELTKPVEFQNLQSDKNINNADIRELILVDQVHSPRFGAPESTAQKKPVARPPVIIENRTYDIDNKLVEQQKIVVPQAEVNVETGAIKSKGPGAIATHRYKKPSNRPANAESDPFGALSGGGNKSGISFLQINFDGEMEVLAEKKEIVIKRNIRSVYSPVPNWQTTFNPDLPQANNPGAVYLTCDRLELAQWTPRSNEKASNEITAIGNTFIKSDSFEATASRVTYSQLSDLLVIAGGARSDAHLKTTTDNLYGEKFTYRVKDKSFTGEGIKNGNRTER